ncbi:helix-turn-helix domain-containing protein [Pseudogemmobacter sp. W21_MBD1_M6]|uniref:helix-turn-helix domain-containing protein n=1 Tax=Pseudogemmobacter sp. W21_MBD1_M6 TaxID=3240271 RepID=UPI003F95895F
MSHAATNWAIQRRGLKPTTKIVLWHLCDRFNPDYGCFPSQERLAHDCEIGRATLNRHLDDLEAHGLIRRIRNVDARTGQQRPTRYLLGFEPGFTPSGPGEPEGDDNAPRDADDPEPPCPDMRHGDRPEKTWTGNDLSAPIPPEPCLDLGHGSVSHFDANPCLKNGDSRVSKWDTNLVREPLREPVKEEEDARGREIAFDDFFGELLQALGFDADGALPAWWQGWPARLHVQRWIENLGLSEDQVIEVARETRHTHPAPPDGPKALDRAMERAARRDAEAANHATASDRAARRQRKRDAGPRPSDDRLAAFYADMVNSDRFLPANAISSAMCGLMLARKLVTPEQLRLRGVL